MSIRDEYGRTESEFFSEASDYELEKAKEEDRRIVDLLRSAFVAGMRHARSGSLDHVRVCNEFIESRGFNPD